MEMIKVQNVCKKIDKQSILKDVSFEVRQGEIVGFLGLNGAGKSTLLKIMAGYVPACSGEVFVGTFSMNKNPLRAQKHIGYLPEQNPLYMDMYPKEYLYFIADLHTIYKQEKRKITNYLMQKLGLQEQIQKRIRELSKGYRQRIGLAASLIHNPKILLLDEPTTGLDPNQLIFFGDYLKELSKEKTIFFSTHALQEVASICDRVIILKNGKKYKDFYLREVPENQTITYLQALLKA